MKPKTWACGGGRTPSTPAGAGRLRTGSAHQLPGSSEAREMPESTKPSSPMFFRNRIWRGPEGGGGPVTSKSSSKSSATHHQIPPGCSPEPGSSLAGSPLLLARPQALEGAGPGQEAVAGTPTPAPGSWVTEPAGVPGVQGV